MALPQAEHPGRNTRDSAQNHHIRRGPGGGGLCSQPPSPQPAGHRACRYLLPLRPPPRPLTPLCLAAQALDASRVGGSSGPPDVLCLQEVQADHYAEWWEPELAAAGYTGHFAVKTRVAMG